MSENTCTVLYEGWQMECCGTPFCIGDTVLWPITNRKDGKVIGSDMFIPYYYEAHSSDYQNISMLQGIVTQIDVLYQTYELAIDGKYYTPVSGFTRPAEKANGDDIENHDPPFHSYIVQLKNISIRPAEQSEITFR